MRRTATAALSERGYNFKNFSRPSETLVSQFAYQASSSGHSQPRTFSTKRPPPIRRRARVRNSGRGDRGPSERERERAAGLGYPEAAAAEAPNVFDYASHSRR